MKRTSAAIGGAVNALAQGLSTGQIDSIDVLKAAATAYATAGASLATTTAVNVGTEGAVSWARDESTAETLSKMLLSAAGTAVGYKAGEFGKAQADRLVNSYSASVVSKPAGILTIEGPYTRSAVPSMFGNFGGSATSEVVTGIGALLPLQNLISEVWKADQP